MAARPHDADEPDAVEPDPVDAPGDDDAPAGPTGADATDADATDPHAGPAGTPTGGGPSDDERRIIDPNPDDVEARWLELVAQLEEPAGDLGAPPPGQQAAAAASDRARVVRPATPPGPRAWSPDPAVEEAEDHFEPPDPGPVLAGDPLLTMAWTVVVGAPALLLIAVVAWRDIPTVVLEAAGIAFLAGIGLLLWRMPRHRDDDSGPGAVV